MKKKIIFFFLMIPCLLQAQYYISSDRPDQSEGVYTMPKNVFQAEWGIATMQKKTISSTTLRYGMSKATEIRLSFDLQGIKKAETIGTSIKQKIYSSQSWLPSITAVGYLVYTPDIQKKWSTDFTIAFEKNILENLSVDWNIGINQQYKKYIYTTELNYSPIEKLNIFAEYYLNLEKQFAQHNVDFGLMYAINRDFQVDVAVGQTLFLEEEQPFASIGFSYRFKEID